MARSKTDIAGMVSGAGLIASIFPALAKAVSERGGTSDAIHRLTTDEGAEIIGRMADAIVGGVAGQPLDLVERWVRAGHYDIANPNITSANFPVAASSVPLGQMNLVHFGRPLSDEAVLAEIDRQDSRPATLLDLLFYGYMNPDLQRQYRIVTLGSALSGSDGRHYYCCLGGGSNARYLELISIDDDWSASYRFLVVTK